VASIPADYVLARFTFPLKNALGFVFMSFQFAPLLAFVIPLYLIYQRLGLYNTHIGMILTCQLVTLPLRLNVMQLLHGNTIGNAGSCADRRLFVARHSPPANPAGERAGYRDQSHPGFHVLLARVQLSDDTRGPRDFPL
jgi:hypothetical protein